MISKITAAIQLIQLIIAFAEQVKTTFGVADNTELETKLSEASAVLAAANTAINTAAPAFPETPAQ